MNVRMASESLENAAPTLANLAIFENNGVIEEFRQNFRTINACNENLRGEIRKLSEKTEQISGEIKQAFIQSDENTLKSLYNSAHCTTSQSKIAWIRVSFFYYFSFLKIYNFFKIGLSVPAELPERISNHVLFFFLLSVEKIFTSIHTKHVFNPTIKVGSKFKKKALI